MAKIIWVAKSLTYEESAMHLLKDRIPSLEWDFYDSVAGVMGNINSKEYAGLYVGNLWIPLLGRPEIFGLIEQERNSHYGGGLYIVRQARGRGLPTLVNPLTEDEKKDAKSLGAVVLDCHATEEWLVEAEQKFREMFRA